LQALDYGFLGKASPWPAGSDFQRVVWNWPRWGSTSVPVCPVLPVAQNVVVQAPLGRMDLRGALSVCHGINGETG